MKYSALLVSLSFVLVACTERGSDPTERVEAVELRSGMGPSTMMSTMASMGSMATPPRDPRFAELTPNCAGYCAQANACRGETRDGTLVECAAACAAGGEYAEQTRAFRCVGQPCPSFASCRSLYLAVDHLRESVRGAEGESNLPPNFSIPPGPAHQMTPTFGGARVHVAMYQGKTVAGLEQELLARVQPAGWTPSGREEHARALSFALRPGTGAPVLVRIEQQGAFTNLTVIQPPGGDLEALAGSMMAVPRLVTEEEQHDHERAE